MSSQVVKTIFQEVYKTIAEHEDELGKLDSVAGDGDHGIGMVRGLKAAQKAAEEAESKSAADMISDAGAAFSDAAGGSSGALVGILIITIGNKFPDEVTTSGVHEAVHMGYERMKTLGNAEPGQKTMLDTLHPFLEALEGAKDKPLTEAWQEALPAAEEGMEATKEMKSEKGRASQVGRGGGHLDPGAVSMNYMLRAVSEVLKHA